MSRNDRPPVKGVSRGGISEEMGGIGGLTDQHIYITSFAVSLQCRRAEGDAKTLGIIVFDAFRPVPTIVNRSENAV